MNRQKLNDFISFITKFNENAYCSMFHGITHWQHVEAFGLAMADQCPAADRDVITWFAYLHDCMRGCEGVCMQHGPAAAKFINKIRKTYLSDLSDEQVRTLKMACRYHTSRRRTGNLTADICLDADRLDLPRVNITPDPKLMASDIGKKLAGYSYEDVCVIANI